MRVNLCQRKNYGDQRGQEAGFHLRSRLSDSANLFILNRMLKSLSIIAYIGMAGGLLVLLATRNLLSASILVIAPQVAALWLLIWARITFGRRSFHVAANPTPGGLVTTGPYRFIRHPIYTAICLFSVPGVAAHWAWPAALLGAVVVACALVRMFLEEKLLVARYPEYRQYAARTSRMIPFVF